MRGSVIDNIYRQPDNNNNNMVGGEGGCLGELTANVQDL